MEKILFSSPRLKIRKLLSDKIYSRAAVSNTRLENSSHALRRRFSKNDDRNMELWKLQSLQASCTWETLIYVLWTE